MQASIDFCDLRELHQRLADLKGRVVVAQHFATWCSGCVDELPLILGVKAELAAQPGGEGSVAFVGISWDLFLGGDRDEARRELEALAQEHALDVPIWVYTGEPPALMDRFAITTGTIPHTIVYGKQGDVVERFPEPFADEADARRLRHAIEVALARP